MSHIRRKTVFHHRNKEECKDQEMIQKKSTTPSDSFTIMGLWVLGLAASHINESKLQTYESRTLFLMTSLQYYCIL